MWHQTWVFFTIYISTEISEKKNKLNTFNFGNGSVQRLRLENHLDINGLTLF